MTRREMAEYKKCSEVTKEECCMGGHYCTGCMYAFPGSAALDLMDTDVCCTDPDVCTMARKQKEED